MKNINIKTSPLSASSACFPARVRRVDDDNDEADGFINAFFPRRANIGLIVCFGLAALLASTELRSIASEFSFN